MTTTTDRAIDRELTADRRQAVESTANMRFGMPATWDDMLALGLDPTTGEALR